jgi:DNA-binding MarR family transcriptional regulator
MNKIRHGLKDNTDYELWVLIDHFHSAMSRARELELARLDITLEQAAILSTLMSLRGSTTNAAIADIMVRQYPSTTTLITRMEKLGLVKKEKTASRKSFTVTITPRGENIVNQITYNSLRMVFEDLSLADKQKLMAYMRQLVEKCCSLIGFGQKLPFLSELEK